MRDLGLLLLGSFLTLVGGWAKSLFDRRTFISNQVFTHRLESLKTVWRAINDVKNTCNYCIPLGRENWERDYKKEALKQLDEFRNLIEENQIQLSPEIIKALKGIDLYLYFWIQHPVKEELKPSNFVEKLQKHLDNLSSAINQTMEKSTHKVQLQIFKEKNNENFLEGMSKKS